MFTPEILAAAARLLGEARARGLRIVTAESCTGGLVAAALTEIAGSSDVVERGFVTYSNTAKSELLGVPTALIAEAGVVSGQVAMAMATGALLHSWGDIAVSVTGLAGPGGGTALKPVGLVHLAAARRGRETSARECRFGSLSRSEIRARAVLAAFELAHEAIEGP